MASGPYLPLPLLASIERVLGMLPCPFSDMLFIAVFLQPQHDVVVVLETV